MPLSAFRFKKFKVEQAGAAHPVGTDAVLLGAWTDVRDVRHVLDIGTGTGVVALLLAQRLKENWSGVGVELHPESASLARENFAESIWADRLQVWEGAVQEYGQLVENQFDLIVSNPPFFSDLTVSPDKTRSLGRHTASLSPSVLLETAARLLAPDGRFCVVLPAQEGLRFCELAVPLGLYWTRITEVRSRLDKPVERLLLQFEKRPYDFERSELVLFAAAKGEARSAAYQALTADFYLD